jgi:hypothetical protein
MFPIIPGGPAPLVFSLVIGIILIGVFLLIASLAWGSRFTRFEVSDAGLRIRGDLYGRTILFDRLQLDSARVTHLAAEPSLRPRRKTNGSNMPGYWSGWFRLTDGQRALVFLTDRSRFVYLRTHDDYAVLMSPRDPDGLVAALRTRAPATAGRD